MTSLRFAQALKSAVAVIVSGSLFVTTAVTPVAAQTFRAGRSIPAGSSSRAGVAPARVEGVLPLAHDLAASAPLVPALSALAAPSALGLPMPAAAKDGERPATPAPAAHPAKNERTGPTLMGSGPRWVKPALPEASDAGPRWVAPKKTGLRAALVQFLPFLGRSGSETFDGAAFRGAAEPGAPLAAKGSLANAPVLSKPSLRIAAIVNDGAIATPEAARRVGEIRHSFGTPLWAKVVAPLSVAAAVAAAIYFGAVPVLTLAAGLVVSVLAHEVAHIAVLHRLGDQTAEHAGSHSLNPLAHIDAVKTVIVPALSLAFSSLLLPFPILLGAGKPVDADFNNLRSPFGGPRSARNAFWVAAAGPATNLLIAGLAFGAVALLPAGGVLAVVALGLAKMNLALAAFNMLPLPQLDGGKILASVLPERFYAKWVFNPRVERGYQSVFRRLYEGPSNVLTWLADAMGVRTQKGVNRLANTVTFTALAAFYAAAYFSFGLGLPLLFLALPCSYDYWCIHEKVRSEAAVQDLMELMSQWSAVIVQISEDLGLESEVSAFETEHAMKNALESLVDEMMAKEEFRALSAEQKLEALMKEYPDKAAEHLKKTAMPEDSLEKIKAVLADPRNGPFYERLRKWFKDHEIFARWDNAHQRGKMKDALDEAEKLKERGVGGPGGAVLPALAALGLGAGMGLFPDWAPHAAAAFGSFGVFGMFGVLAGSGEAAAPNPLAKVTAAADGLHPDIIEVTFVENATPVDIERAFGDIGHVHQPRPGAALYRVPLLGQREDAVEIVRRIAGDPAVAHVVAAPELDVRLTAAPRAGAPAAEDEPASEDAETEATPAPDPMAKVRRDSGTSRNEVDVILVAEANRHDVDRIFAGLEYRQISGLYRVTLVAREDDVAIVQGIAGDALVETVLVHPELYAEMVSPAPIPASAPAPIAASAPSHAVDPMVKVRAASGMAHGIAAVKFAANTNQDTVERIFQGVRYSPAAAGGRNYVVHLDDRADTKLVVRRIARDVAVESVAVPPDLYAAMELSAPEPVGAPRAPIRWESKLVRAEIIRTEIRVVFNPALDAARIRERLDRYNFSSRRAADLGWGITARSIDEAAEIARTFAGDADVERVTVSPDVHARLTGTTVAPRAEVPPVPPRTADPNWQAKISLGADGEWNLYVNFSPSVNVAEEEVSLLGYGPRERVSPHHWRISVLEISRGAEIARTLAEDARVERVVVSSQIQAGLPPVAPAPQAGGRAPERVPASEDPMRKVSADTLMSHGSVVVIFRGDANPSDAERVFAGFQYIHDLEDAPSTYSLPVAGVAPDLIARRIAGIARDVAVERIVVSSDIDALLRGEAAAPQAEPARAPQASADPNWAAKIAREEGMEGKIHVFDSSTDAEAFSAMLDGYGAHEKISAHAWKLSVPDAGRAAEIARELAGRADVGGVGVAADVKRILLPPLTLPAKVASHGKAEYGVGVLLVRFAAGTAEADIRAALSRQGQNTLYRHDGMYTVSATNAKQAREKAVALAAEETVAAVKVHPNVAAKMIEDEEPYPDALAYDHERAILVEFREETSAEAAAEYAAVRRLRLVHPKFRGSERTALFEVPEGAGVRATLEMLADETAVSHSAAESVRPFQEQPGEPELTRRAPPVVVEESRPEVAAARRDPAQAWLEYLQNVTLSDGKSKLTDKQIQILSAMLKPLARQPDAPRPPIVSRNDEVKRMLPIVTSPRGMRNSVILVGEAGVGKTAVAEGLAEMIEDATAATAADSQAFLQFERLKGRWLVELDINQILTQEDPVALLSAILDLLPRLNAGGPSRGNDVIVLMDEIQKFFLDKAGQKIANTLKGPLRDGKISVIATTTNSEYKKFIETDDAFRRRFEKIDVAEPTVPQTIAILRAMKAWLQTLHDAVIPDEALVSAAKLADQFDKTNFNPDKAIKAVQDAAELSRPDNLRAAVTLDLREAWGELVVAANEARQALVDKGIASTLALPVDLYNKIAALVQKAESLYAEREAVAEGKGQVTTDVVKRVIAAKTGIASGQLNLGEDDAARYTKMEEEIGRRVINQDPALTAIANAVRRNKAGLSNPNRPIGKFLLTGPTGVGKTYLAKELARFLFKDPNAMIRLDMSEYMEEHTVQRMTGAPPSYVGYEAGGQLTEAVRKKPYSVLLFDEIEKAHPKVFDVLLQILDDGRLTDGQGRTVDFKNTVIIMTSNGGMSGVDGEKYAKLLAKAKDHNETAEINKLWDEEIDLMVGAALKERFRPEFLNRLDEDPLSKNKWIRVNRLRPEDIAKIASIQLKEFAQLLIDRHDTEIQFDPSVVDFLAVEGYSPLYGARPMTAAIEKHIIDPLAQWILKEAEAGKKDVRGALIKVAYADGKISFAATPKPEKNTARATVQGASEAVAAEVFALIERLSGDGSEEEPSENLFDKLMRKARPAAEASAEINGNAAASRTKAFFAPGTGLSVNGATGNLEHNNAKKKDSAARAFAAALLSSAKAANWPVDVLEALDAPASGPGEGYLKQIVKLAKEQATKAGAAAPVTFASNVNKDAIQIAIGGAYALSEDDQRALEMHFSGAPAASYLAAQQKANSLNLSARLLWDHGLLDLYRRLAAIPGARMGFKTGPEGTQIWLEIKREALAPVAAPKAAAAAGDKLAATPHQVREMAKTRKLLMGVIDQSRLAEHERDGHAIRIAAAEGYAMLASPADLAAAREWIKAKGWAGDVEETTTTDRWGSKTTTTKAEVGADWPLAMTAALLFERFGAAEDVEMLENVARRVTGSSHTEVPVHGALVSALSALYARSGLAATRAAVSRALSMQVGRSTDIADAAKRALGAVGMPVDIDSAQSDADGYLAMMRRLGREEELRQIFRDTALWGENRAEPVRQAALKVAGETETGDAALGRLKNMMRTQTSYSRTGYEMSRAWAAIVAREGLTRGLGDAIKRYLDARGVSLYQKGSAWPTLYAYVATAALAGGADTLGPLEELMNESPGDITPVHEQSYFSAPDAWARALIRSGKFEEYARSQGLNADGSPKPSKLQDMLTNRTRPMFAAAALRAIAYARNPSLARRGVAPKGDLPDIQPDDVPKSAPGGDERFNLEPPADMR